MNTFDTIGERVHGTAEFYRENGHWHILLRAPSWVLSDIEMDLRGKGNVITQANRGSDSMLLVAASWQVRHPEMTIVGRGE